MMESSDQNYGAMCTEFVGVIISFAFCDWLVCSSLKLCDRLSYYILRVETRAHYFKLVLKQVKSSILQKASQ